MSVTGPSRAEIADDASGGGPQKVGVAVADLFTGMYATTAILAALRHRDRTGQGQAIDMALLDTQVAMLANLGAGYLASGVAPSAPATRTRTSSRTRCSRSPTATSSSRSATTASSRASAPSPGAASSRPTRVSRATPVASATARTLIPLLAARLKLRPRAAWLAELEAAKVPVGPINDLAEVFADPQVQRAG